MLPRGSWIRNGRISGLLGIAGALLAVSPARAWPPTALNLQEPGVDNLNLVTISCSPIWDAATGVVDQRRAKCTHTTVRIQRPTSADIEREIAKVDSPEARRKLEAEFPQRCAEVATTTTNPASAAVAEPAEPAGVFLRAASAACRARNLTAYIEATKANIRTLQAHTCKIEHYPARELAFEMRAENLWQAVTSTPERTDLLTLWRSDSGGWNLKQVTAASPTCEGPLCPKDRIIEWRSDAGLKLRDCRYFERG